MALLRVARAADADAGPPLAAHLLPLAAPGRDPGRARRRSSAPVDDAVPLPAPLRALAADDLPAERALARARAGRRRSGRCARWSRAACDGQAIPASQARAAARPPAAPGPALAAADALQRPAAAQAAARVDRHRVELLQQRGARRRRARSSPGRATRPSWRSPRRAARSAWSRRAGARRAAAAVRRRAPRRRARPTTRRSRATGASSPSSPPRATSTSPSATGRCACA